VNVCIGADWVSGAGAVVVSLAVDVGATAAALGIVGSVLACGTAQDAAESRTLARVAADNKPVVRFFKLSPNRFKSSHENFRAAEPKPERADR
jgi:hypothetical protein